MKKRDPVLFAFGKSVKDYREAREMSQEQLAEKADLARTYLSDIERGTRNPGIKNVVRLAKALSITTAQLVKGIDS